MSSFGGSALSNELHLLVTLSWCKALHQTSNTTLITGLVSYFHKCIKYDVFDREMFLNSTSPDSSQYCTIIWIYKLAVSIRISFSFLLWRIIKLLFFENFANCRLKVHLKR